MRVGSVCTGYGGLDQAVHEVLGGELAWVADNDEGATAILAHRFPAVKNLGDITIADWGGVEPVDVLTAGFPCQDVSAAGKRAGLRKGNRSGVWIEVSHAIAALRPGLVVIENVRGLLTARGDEPTDEHLRAEAARDAAVRLEQWLDNELNIALSKGDADRARRIRVRAARVVGVRKRAVARCLWHERRLVRAIGTVLGSLADLGFDAEWVCVGADDAGACHQRKRVFILARPAADTPSARRGGSEDAGAGGRDARGRPWSGQPERDHPATAQPAGIRLPLRQPEHLRRGGRAAATPDGRDTAQHDGIAHQGSATAEDADRTARGQRRLAGPGEAEDWRSRTDAGRPGGAPAIANARSAGLEVGPVEHHGQECPAAKRGSRDAPADAEYGAESEWARDTRREARERAPVGSGSECDSDSLADAYGQDAGSHARGSGDETPAGPGDGPERRRESGPGLSGGPLADASGGGRWPEPGQQCRLRPAGQEPGDIAWGAYGLAIRRWERATGRPAPRPTEPGRTGERLSPRFVEWMMGLPEGWVTDVPGLSRSAQLKALGNGVVPQQAAIALRMLLDRADIAPLVAAEGAA